MSSTLLTDRDGGVAILILHRPEALHTLSSELVRALVGTLSDCDADDGIGAIILTAHGERAFTAGVDRAEADDGSLGLGPDEDPVAAIVNCRKPVLAAVNGLCVSAGLEIILACDAVFAARTARFADRFVHSGRLPTWGLSQRLARQIGPQRAKELSLSGRFIDAERAREIGLVNQIFDPADLLLETLAVAHAIAANDTQSVQLGKKLIDEGYGLALRDAVERGSAVALGFAQRI